MDILRLKFTLSANKIRINPDIALGTGPPFGLTRVSAIVIFSDRASNQMSGTGDDMRQVSQSLLDILSPPVPHFPRQDLSLDPV
jgi:hypothetical protein